MASQKKMQSQAEFQWKQKGILLAWPKKTYKKSYEPPYKTTISMIFQLLFWNVIHFQDKEYKIYLLIEEKNIPLLTKELQWKLEQEAQKELLGIFLEHITLYTDVPYTDFWLRDIGPCFGKDSQEKLCCVDFGFNLWGYDSTNNSKESIIDEGVDRLVANKWDAPIMRTSIVGEGGDREFNGKGCLIMSSVVSLNRNGVYFGNSLEAIEKEYKRIFVDLKKIIWMQDGPVDDNQLFLGKIPNTDIFPSFGTGGHVDEFCRFISEDTIVLGQVLEEDLQSEHEEERIIAKLTHERLERNLEILKQATDASGKPFTIVRLPQPPSIFETVTKEDPLFEDMKSLTFTDGSAMTDAVKIVLAASYMNFLISNHVVLVAKYYKPGKRDDEVFKKRDEMVLELFQTKLFPDRKVIMIEQADLVNIGGGGMHCISCNLY